jgi:hypothetical protein
MSMTSLFMRRLLNTMRQVLLNRDDFFLECFVCFITKKTNSVFFSKVDALDASTVLSFAMLTCPLSMLNNGHIWGIS